MKVLHLDGGREWAGGQNQVRLLMRELRALGLEQCCMTPRSGGLAARLVSEGLPVQQVDWRGGTDPRAIFAAARLARGFDVLHCHDAHALQIAWIPARLHRRRLVASRRVHFRTSRAKWNRADAVIAISDVVRAALVASGVAENRVHRISDGIDVEEVRRLPPIVPTLRERLGVSKTDFLIASIGKLSAYKGQTIIPPAAMRLDQIHWAVIGEGPLRGDLERAVAECDVYNKVHLTGVIDDARRVLQELDLFVFPSPDEPLGTTILDAMAAGVPVVAARAAGAAEILGAVDERTKATLYPPRNADALASLIRQVRDDARLRAEMVRAQNDRIAHFTIASTAAATVRLYESLFRGTAAGLATR